FPAPGDCSPACCRADSTPGGSREDHRIPMQRRRFIHHWWSAPCGWRHDGAGRRQASGQNLTNGVTLMNSRRRFINSAAGVAMSVLASSPISRADGREPQTNDKDKFVGTGKRDYYSNPFKMGVALGESTTAGGTATSRELTWVSRLADLINESQL